MTDTATKSLDELSLAELTEEYNRRCEEIEANHTGMKPLKPFKRIKLFKDRNTALRRIDELTNPPAPKEAKQPAKKAMAKKPKEAKKVKPEKVAKPKKEKTGTLSEEFGFKAGGERSQLLLILSGKMNHQVPRAEFGPLGKFIGKIKLRIERKKLKYRLVREKDEEGVSFGLYSR